ncbi:hypothetical protein ACFE04_025851 [Oxalis oulophora]
MTKLAYWRRTLDWVSFCTTKLLESKVFEVWCLHIPVYDRTPFPELVKLVEETLRLEHDLSPNKPIYLVGDSFGGCLALAVAARNPNIDLVVILSNPGPALKKMEEERGHSCTICHWKKGDGSDCAIATENRQTNDFIILDKHIETPAGLPEKTKLFFAYAAENWNAEFFAKVNDDVYVNVD